MNHGLTAGVADRYRLERELGAGGMATVHLAAGPKHDRKMAIAVLKPKLAAMCWPGVSCRRSRGPRR